MRILISGATGFLGSHLVDSCLDQGDQLTIVSRRPRSVLSRRWSHLSALHRDDLSLSNLAGIEVVVHLAGSSLLDLPWTEKTKQRIYTSRIDTTKQLVASLPASVHTFVSASAIGYYPPDTGQLMDESYTTTQANNFLQQVCIDREDQAYQAATEQRRVVSLRTGLVTGKGWFEDKLHLATKRTGGRVIWSGTQYLPLISVDQWTANVMAILHDQSLSGPINMVSQNITMHTLVTQTAQQVHRPVIGHLPTRLIKALLGEASMMLLGSRQVAPSSMI